MWKLDLTAGGVEIARDHWHLRGNVSAWLRSDVFDLGDDRSVEAEAACRGSRPPAEPTPLLS
ncbi:MAG: hypothetical protein IPN01_12470 [Deltaproteobacteria bacterium]|nr:hypothetical protein [Deltaproteobacteria bacterium]